MQESEVSPAERRRLRVREAILDAAERVFAQEGEAGLSIRRIADEIEERACRHVQSSTTLPLCPDFIAAKPSSKSSTVK